MDIWYISVSIALTKGEFGFIAEAASLIANLTRTQRAGRGRVRVAVQLEVIELARTATAVGSGSALTPLVRRYHVGVSEG